MLLLALLAALPAQADPRWNFSCDYSFMGMPTASVALESLPGGGFGEAARVTIQGRAHLESFTEAERAPDELLHGWLSHGTQNELELVVYREAKAGGQSKLVNHHIPYGKEMWGNCQAL